MAVSLELFQRMLVRSYVVLDMVLEFILCVDASVKLNCIVLNAVSMNCSWFAIDPSVPTTYKMFYSVK